jgi:predicted ATP-dependent serine protease
VHVAEADWPLVGRDEELDLLLLNLGARGSVVIAGGPGVGKSRLAADFLDRAAQDGLRTVLARATRSTATIPFGSARSPRGRPGREGAAPDRLAVLRAIERQLVNGDERVLVAVDDAHSLDAWHPTLTGFDDLGGTVAG